LGARTGCSLAAKTVAGFYSLIETAKLCGVEPGKYLTAVLRVITDYEDGEDMDQLLPDAYAWRVNGGHDLPALEKQNS